MEIEGNVTMNKYGSCSYATLSLPEKSTFLFFSTSSGAAEESYVVISYSCE